MVLGVPPCVLASHCDTVEQEVGKAGSLTTQLRSCPSPGTALSQISVSSESDFPIIQSTFSWASCCVQPKAC